MFLFKAFVSFAVLAGLVSSLIADSQLTGTWKSKSKKVTTGPSFYDYKKDRLIEPRLPGISYSFSDNGHYESSYYRAISNPVNPACPKAMLQWQHGTWKINSTGSLKLTPIAADGRQSMSDWCRHKNAIYSRYSQNETFQKYEVFTDPYYNVMRLNLFNFDGSPLLPLYLSSKTPVMVPTSRLNASQSNGKKKNPKTKRDISSWKMPPIRMKIRSELTAPDRWWWLGLGLTGLGGYLFFCV